MIANIYIGLIVSAFLIFSKLPIWAIILCIVLFSGFIILNNTFPGIEALASIPAFLVALIHVNKMSMTGIVVFVIATIAYIIYWIFIGRFEVKYLFSKKNKPSSYPFVNNDQVSRYMPTTIYPQLYNILKVNSGASSTSNICAELIYDLYQNLDAQLKELYDASSSELHSYIFECIDHAPVDAPVPDLSRLKPSPDLEDEKESFFDEVTIIIGPLIGNNSADTIVPYVLKVEDYITSSLLSRACKYEEECNGLLSFAKEIRIYAPANLAWDSSMFIMLDADSTVDLILHK
ncbi:MAG: hypothetical protein IJP98_02425 [Clostridia bacterium]|nr:hypothetical protein [Clostridia bacterium]